MQTYPSINLDFLYFEDLQLLLLVEKYVLLTCL